MNLSPNFTLAEMIRSQAALEHGINNTPDQRTVGELRRLCVTALEPARARLGVRLRILSGYRCPQVNSLVGSTAPHSAHIDGRAADTLPEGMGLREAFDALRSMPDLPFDQLILEPSWIHIGIAREGVIPRREALIATGRPGDWRYEKAPAL